MNEHYRSRISTSIFSKRNLQRTNNHHQLEELDTIMFDTCAILKGDGFEAYVRNIVPYLRSHNKNIVIPFAVLNELIYLGKSVNSTCRERALLAVEEIKALASAKIVTFAGDPKAVEQADYYFVRYSSSKRFDSRIMIITQDCQLAKDLTSLNNISSASVHPIKVRRIDSNGELRDFIFNGQAGRDFGT